MVFNMIKIQMLLEVTEWQNQHPVLNSLLSSILL